MGRPEPSSKSVGIALRSMTATLAIVAVLLLSYGAGLQIGAARVSAPPSHPSGGVPTAAAYAQSQVNAAWASLGHNGGPAAHPRAPGCPAGQVPGRTSTCQPLAPPGPPLPSPGPWLNITTLSSVQPSARACYDMAYDAADQYVVLFSGCVTSGTNGETWTYSHGVWTKLAIPGPQNRTYSMMAYDAADQYVVMYGGQVFSSAVNDTWTFSAGKWTYLKLTTFPKPREAAGMAYDDNDGYVVLFGGYSTNNFADLKDTWTFKAGAWTSYTYVNASSYPGARQSPAMAYDPNNLSVVLFGGLSASKGTFLSDTWTFAKGNWTKSNATVFPSARESSAMAYDPLLGHVLLFGGDALSGALKDMWAWLGDNWTQVNATTTPSKRTLSTLVWDTADQYGVLFGGAPSGSSRSYFDDTWTLGLNLTSSISVSPSNIDLGETSTFRGAAVGASSYFTYAYSGLPPSCSSQNVTLLACKPTGSAMAYTVMLTVTDNQSRKVFANTTLSVWNGPLISAFTVQPAAISLGQTVWFNTTAAGGVGTLKYLYTGAPGLPSGCSTHNLTTFSCVPRAKGSFTLNVTVTDGLGGHNNATANLVVNSDPAIASFLPTAPQIDLGQSTTLKVNATGGTGTLTYTYFGLPAGCSGASTPALACKPTQTGTFNITVLVVDQSGYNVSRGTSITINADPIITTYRVSPSAVDLGQAVTFVVNASLGTGSLTYSYVGLPKGCQSTNVSFFACTPTATGPFTVNVSVVDLVAWTVGASAGFSVHPDPAVTGFAAAPAQIDLGQSLALTANVSGGTGIFTYSYSGLPLGCTVANSPMLNCTPTVTGAFVIHLTVRDSAGKSSTGTASVSVQADLSLVAFTISPSASNPGTNTSFSIVVRGGTGARTYNYTGLPAGCSSVNSPSFFCSPTTPGTYNVDVQVTDAAQFSLTANASFVVNKTASSGTGGSGSSTSISTLDLLVIVGLVALVIVIAAVAMMRRRPPASSAGTTEDGSEGDTPPDEATSGEMIYGGSAPPQDTVDEGRSEPPSEPPAYDGGADEVIYGGAPPPRDEVGGPSAGMAQDAPPYSEGNE